MELHQDRCLIYGCMRLGGGWTPDPVSAEDERVAYEAITTAMDIGIDTFDHADIYARGKAEEAFGRVMKSNPGLREKMLVQSKVGIHLGHGPKNANTYNFSREYLLSQVDTMVKRLATGYLDMLLLHRPDALMDPEEVAGTFEALRTRGLVKRFGVSNMSIHQIQLLQKYWTEPLMANQLQLSLGHALVLDMGATVNTRRIAFDSGMQGMLEYCQLNRMAIQAWSPLDRGLYTDRPADQLNEREAETSQMVAQFAERHGVTPSAIVLAWLLKIPGTIQPVIGTSKPERIRACKDALSVPLTRDEWYQLWITARGENLP